MPLLTMKSYCREHVTVGIVGGGIAGLSLARMLEMSGISYCLWEAYSEFAPSVGASLGLTPSGLRILDQIGVFENINRMTVPHQRWEHRDRDGNLHAEFTALRMSPELYVYLFARMSYWTSR